MLPAPEAADGTAVVVRRGAKAPRQGPGGSKAALVASMRESMVGVQGRHPPVVAVQRQ